MFIHITVYVHSRIPPESDPGGIRRGDELGESVAAEVLHPRGGPGFPPNLFGDANRAQTHTRINELWRHSRDLITEISALGHKILAPPPVSIKFKLGVAK